MTRSAAIFLLVAAIGCGDNSEPAKRCEMGAPWDTAPDLLFGPAQETVGAAVDGKIYIMGGFQSGALGNVVQVFDTKTCEWSQGPDLPTDIHHANAAVVDGTIYIVGAMRDGGAYTAIGDTWSWHPATETAWTVRTPMPVGTQRGSSAVGVIDGKIWVAGGLRNGSRNDVSFYDPAADTWTDGPPLLQLRDHACGGVIGGKLYVAGGRNLIPTQPEANLYELTPGVGWIERARMPTARAGAACAVIGDRLIVAGGERNTAAGSRGVFSQVEAYDPTTDSWESLAPMPTPRHGMGAATWDGRLYIPGGADQEAAGAVAVHEVLTP